MSRGENLLEQTPTQAVADENYRGGFSSGSFAIMNQGEYEAVHITGFDTRDNVAAIETENA